MKRYLLILSALFVTGVLTTSCNEWDDHYNTGVDKNSVVRDETLYDYLKSVPEYSEFMDLMEKTGLAEEFKRNQVLTVWAVNNDNWDLDLSDYSRADLVRLARHHINYLSMSSDMFEVGRKFNTLTRKYVTFAKTVEDRFSLAGMEILSTDVRCKNGVVNEIKGALIPRDNVYEAIARLDDSYSRLRDTILSYNDTIFDEENSFPLYVDDDGNTVFDTVWVIQNVLFKAGGDFRTEELEFTLFKYSNAVLEAALASAISDFGGIQSITEDEYLALNMWPMRAFLYKGLEFQYDRNTEMRSLWNLLWRTDIQEADRNYQRGSNCVIYDITSLYIPRSILSVDIDFNIVETFYPDVVNNYPDKLGEWFKHSPLGEDLVAGVVVSLNPMWVSSGTWWYLSMTPWQDTVTPLWYEFTVLRYNSRGAIIPARFYPGTYDVEVAIRPYASGNNTVYFNGQQVYSGAVSGTQFGGSTSGVGYVPPPLRDGEGKYTVAASQNLVIRVEQQTGNNTAGNKRLTIHGWRFHPDRTIY